MPYPSYHLIEKIVPSLKLEIKIFWTAIVPVINMLGMAPNLERRKEPVFMANIFGAKNWRAGSKQSYYYGIWISLAQPKGSSSYRVFT